jgi:phosphatidylglycerol lysyltransferase
MTTKLLYRLASLLGLLLFAGALWVLYHELRDYSLHDILRTLHDLAGPRLFAALALTLLSYLIMTGYDILALRYIHHPLKYRRIALASFISYAMSNNIGFGMIAGGSVRYRLYSAWGLSSLEITKVLVFCTVTLWLGFVALAGGVFLFNPPALPKALPLPFTSVRPLALLFLLILGGYVTAATLIKKPLRIRDWQFAFPSLHLLIAQLVVAPLDWALAGTVLYTLLPGDPGLSYQGFLGIFLVAQMLGLLSQVPGGLGVFETAVIVLLSGSVKSPAVIASLLAYRGIYYLLPLSIASAGLGAQEVLRGREKFLSLAQLVARYTSRMTPSVLTVTTFIGGAVLLFSGATPEVHSRLAWLKNFLPLPVLEISHFLGSLAGMALLLLARGLQRRLDAAFLLSAILLGSGILLSLLKGLDYEEAAILAVLLAVLLSCRRQFYRKASLLSQRFSFGWILAIAMVLLCTLWLGVFSYKHLHYSRDLWWRFTFFGNAPRSLRAMVGVIGLAFFFGLARLLRPAPPRYALPETGSLDRITPIVEGSRRTYAYLALLGDKALLVSDQTDAFIMYRVEGRSWVAMGDPVGSIQEWPELVWRFQELADVHDGWVVFYGVGPGNLTFYLDIGLSPLRLGEEARVLLSGFSLEGRRHKLLRNTCNRLEKEGCTFAVLPRQTVPSVLPELKKISDTWLLKKNTREKGFSLGFFHEDYLKRCPLAVVRMEGQIVAFANLWPGADREELSIDLMRYLPEAPHGVMDYLFVQLMLWGKKEGYSWFNLGMAPLARLQNKEDLSLWSRFGTFLFRHGEHFYNFQGLRRYKAKFDPVWEPRYLAGPAGIALPRILTNIGSVISGGLAGLIVR